MFRYVKYWIYYDYYGYILLNGICFNERLNINMVNYLNYYFVFIVLYIYKY